MNNSRLWSGRQNAVVRFTGGPDRIYDDDPKPFVPRPVGFGVPIKENEPLLWEGDNS